jgi:hypothetical protein
LLGTPICSLTGISRGHRPHSCLRRVEGIHDNLRRI